ncbi:MAG: hypothetical protein IJV96_06330, partial [Clostridia bacterium]|nr:hypothetical protein [Clostridia bacterium]
YFVVGRRSRLAVGNYAVASLAPLRLASNDFCSSGISHSPMLRCRATQSARRRELRRRLPCALTPRLGRFLLVRRCP